VSRVLVLSPHPDDESIGCGGTLRDHVMRGDRVEVIFLTSGERGVRGRPPEEVARVREREAAAAAAILGLAQIEFWREPDGLLRGRRRLVERLRSTLAAFRPEVLYVPHLRDMHPDHRAMARLARGALADAQTDVPPVEARMFEVWTPLQRIDWVVDISPHLDAKLAAVRAHESQCAIMRFDEAVRGLARYRGEMHSWPGGDYAEVFERLQR
jgi:N-acetylglucosamine malate deacetylase 1